MENTHEYIKDGESLERLLEQSKSINTKIGKIKIVKDFSLVLGVGSFVLANSIARPTGLISLTDWYLIQIFAGAAGGCLLSFLQCRFKVTNLKYTKIELDMEILRRNVPKRRVQPRIKILRKNLPKQYVKK